MNTIFKVGVGAVTLSGIALFSSVVAEKLRKKWFIHGFESGQAVGYANAAENYSQVNDDIIETARNIADSAAAIISKYDKLCDDYAELENAYDELCAESDYE